MSRNLGGGEPPLMGGITGGASSMRCPPLRGISKVEINRNSSQKKKKTVTKRYPELRGCAHTLQANRRGAPTFVEKRLCAGMRPKGEKQNQKPQRWGIRLQKGITHEEADAIGGRTEGEGKKGQRVPRYQESQKGGPKRKIGLKGLSTRDDHR